MRFPGINHVNSVSAPLDLRSAPKPRDSPGRAGGRHASTHAGRERQLWLHLHLRLNHSEAALLPIARDVKGALRSRGCHLLWFKFKDVFFTVWKFVVVFPPVPPPPFACPPLLLPDFSRPHISAAKYRRGSRSLPDCFDRSVTLFYFYPAKGSLLANSKSDICSHGKLLVVLFLSRHTQ